MTSPPVDGIRKRQGEDLELMKINKKVEERKIKDFQLKEGVIWFKGTLCVPHITKLKKEVMNATHNSTFATHPMITTMYHYMKTDFWWIGMNGDVADFWLVA